MQAHVLTCPQSLRTASVDAARWAALTWAALGAIIGGVLICAFEMVDNPALTGPTLLAMVYISCCAPTGYRWCRKCSAELKLAGLMVGICLSVAATAACLGLTIAWLAIHHPDRLELLGGVLLVCAFALTIETIE